MAIVCPVLNNIFSVGNLSLWLAQINGESVNEFRVMNENKTCTFERLTGVRMKDERQMRKFRLSVPALAAPRVTQNSQRYRELIAPFVKVFLETRSTVVNII